VSFAVHIELDMHAGDESRGTRRLFLLHADTVAA
jgi:hypothetical protein